MSLLSIIVPVYNVEDFLSECVDSILAQSLTDLELILVDDGSSDSSGVICDRYAAKDNRIKVIHKANGGLSSARNAGLDKMTGKYVTFVDSDDVILGKNTFEDIVKILDSDEVDVVQYDVIFKYKSPFEHRREYPFMTYQGKPAILKGYLEENIHVSFCDKIFRSEVIKGVRFPLNQISEDIATIPALVASIETLRTVPIGSYGYRYREGSISNSDLPYEKICSILDSYFKYLSYARNYPELNNLIFSIHAGILWYYISIVRRNYPEAFKDFKSRNIFLHISLREYLRVAGKFNRKDKIRVFATGVMGPAFAMRLQRVFSKNA